MGAIHHHMNRSSFLLCAPLWCYHYFVQPVSAVYVGFVTWLALVSCMFHTYRERDLEERAKLSSFTANWLYTVDILNISVAAWWAAFGDTARPVYTWLMFLPLGVNSITQNTPFFRYGPLGFVMACAMARMPQALLPLILSVLGWNGTMERHDAVKEWPERLKCLWHGGFGIMFVLYGG